MGMKETYKPNLVLLYLPRSVDEDDSEPRPGAAEA
jgi:hypothetical protein